VIKKVIIIFSVSMAVVAYLWSQSIPTQTINQEIAGPINKSIDLGPGDQISFQATGRPPVTFTVPLNRNAKVHLTLLIILTPP